MMICTLLIVKFCILLAKGERYYRLERSHYSLNYTDEDFCLSDNEMF